MRNLVYTYYLRIITYCTYYYVLYVICKISSQKIDDTTIPKNDAIINGRSVHPMFAIYMLRIEYWLYI